MSEFLRQYLTVAIFGGAAVLMVGAMLGMGRLLRPTRPQTGKYINYECGVDPVGVGWSQSQIRYYVFALLFVMFDAGSTRSGCTSGAWPAAPSRWAPPSGPLGTT
jgi:NADH-quinone oxidoreductase subunit A